MFISHFFHQLAHISQFIFLRFKHYALVVFCVAVFLPLLFSNGTVFGEAVVSNVETPIQLSIDHQYKKFTSHQSTVKAALEQEGFSLSKNDITVPALETTLNGEKINVKVIRAIPVLISDNNQEFLADSAYTEPMEILKQINVTIYPEDKVVSDLILDPADEQAVGQKVMIARAPVYIVHVDDQDLTVRSWGTTIRQVLEGKVQLGLRDVVEPSLDSQAFGGEITITRVNVVDTTENITIPYRTIYQKDYSMYEGETKTKQAGADGQKTEQVRYTYHNGQIISRVVLDSTIVSQPVTAIIVEGVKPYNAGVWWDTLVAAGSRWGVDPRDMYNVMNCESHGNPYAGTTYKGLFQYSASTWAGASAAYPGGVYKGAAITNGTAQIYVTAWKVSRDGWAAWGCKP